MFLSFALVVFSTALLVAQSPNYPFPQHVTYSAGTIKPNNHSQPVLDGAVQSYYSAWRDRYLIAGCDSNTYYVWYNDLGYDGPNICVSEGQGYGMVIVALMAGYDSDAQLYFDGLYNWYKEFPSGIDSRLMSWRQKNPNCQDNGFDSATDGDLDIAYGLLLADKQWGSGGAINYQQEALNIISGIVQSEVYASAWNTQLGDWSHADSFYRDDSRPSDFMLDHFRSYFSATGNMAWNQVLEESYNLIGLIQTSYSPSTGLLPDFIEDCDGRPHPARPNFLEGPNDGAYSYNACRTPWRMGTDYLVNGDARAKAACDKINSWIRSKTANNVEKIRAGYKLNGVNLRGNNYQDLAFVAPFAVSAMTDAANQAWLNSLWDNIEGVSLTRDGYYGNTIKMLCMIVASGNWWAPQQVALANGEK